MSYGLEVFDESGTKVIGVDERTARFVTSFYFERYVDQNGASFTEDFSIPGIAADGTWIAFMSNLRGYLSIPSTGTLRLHADPDEVFPAGYDYKSVITVMRT